MKMENMSSAGSSSEEEEAVETRESKQVNERDREYQAERERAADRYFDKMRELELDLQRSNEGWKYAERKALDIYAVHGAPLIFKNSKPEEYAAWKERTPDWAEVQEEYDALQTIKYALDSLRDQTRAKIEEFKV